MTSIGKQIKDARRAKGWTQDDLAKTMNMSRQAVSHWETDRTMPDAQTLIKLAQTLDYSFETNGAAHFAADAPEDERADAEQPKTGSSLAYVKTDNQILQTGGG